MFHDCIRKKLTLFGDKIISVMGGAPTFFYDDFRNDNSSNDCNVDLEFNEIFDELFGEHKAPTPKKDRLGDSALIKLIQQKEKQSFFDDWTASKGNLSKKRLDAVEERKRSLLHYGVDGRNFSLSDQPGEKTLVFEVVEEIDPLPRTFCAKINELDSTEVLNPDGTVIRTYYIDEPRRDGNYLLFLTISNHRIVINNGVLDFDKVLIEKDPIFFTFKNYYVERKHNDNMVDLTTLSNGEQGRVISKKTVLLGQVEAHTYLIDIANRALLRREPYYDKQKNQWLTRIQVYEDRPCFAFQIRIDNKVHKSLTDLQSGTYFLENLYGFPKDIGMAASLFEKDNSAEALLGIAYIFLCEPRYKDVNLGVEYLNKAIEKGSSRAKTELALLHLEMDAFNHFDTEILLSAAAKQDAFALFLIGVFSELSIIDNMQLDECFEYYFEAAMKECVPAQVRLGKMDDSSPCKWGETQNKEILKRYFLNNASKLDGIAELLLGDVLLSGEENFTHIELGISFMEKSIKKGNRDAILELHDFYVNKLLNKGNVDISKLTECAEAVLSFIDDSKELYEKANTMLDIEPSIPVLDRLSMKFLEKAIRLYPEYGSAINNLAWMIKNGRGIEQDYDKAQELFEMAASLGVSASYFHLGDMYENGLGMDKSLEKAIEYYQKGAELENQKCRDRIDILTSASIDESNEYLKRIYKYVVETNAKVMEIGDLTKEMKALMESIVDVHSEISSRKAAFQSQENGEDSIEKAYKQFVDSMAETMCRKLYQSGNSNVEFEENTLKGIFGDYWDCLDDYTRRSLVSARVFLSGSNTLSRESLDYSGVVIGACSGLENECKLRFFKGFKQYLRNRFKNDYSKWPKSMVYKGNKENTNFTIGSLPSIFGSRQRQDNGKRIYKDDLSVTRSEKELLNEYLKTILYHSDDDIRVFFKEDLHGLSFLDRCEDVRCIYRNAAAHTETLSLEKATDCCRDIIGVDRYDAAQEVGRIQGLILDLVKLTKIPNDK